LNPYPFIDRQQRPRETADAEPRFGRSVGEAAVRSSTEPVSRDNDLARLTRLIQHQSEQSAEIQRSVAVIATFLNRDESSRVSQQQDAKLETISARLRRIEDALAKLTAPAPPLEISSQLRAGRPKFEAAQTKSASPEPAKIGDLADGFHAAYRDLAAEGAIEQSDKVMATIEAIAQEQNLPWDSRAEALVKATFSLLPKTLNRWSPTSLQAFLARLLGPSSSLIRPKIGDALDLTAHNDCSIEVAGTRSRVREVIFPGVRQGERVLVRALVHT
jgi:hypothetical protein